MAQTYAAQIQRCDGWWISWVREVSRVTCQERTREELLETLKIILTRTRRMLSGGVHQYSKKQV